MKTKTIYLVLILGISAFFVIYLPLQPYFDVHAVEEERIELEGEYNSKSFSLWGNGSTFYTGGYINEKALLIRWDCAGNMLWNRTWGSSKMVTELWGDANSVFTITEDTYYSDQNLTKWDSEGNAVWNHSIFGLSNTYAKAIWGNNSDLYTSGRDISWKFTLVKWNSTGQVVWTRTNASLYAGSCLWGNDQCLYVGTPGLDNRTFMLLKWDGEGNLLWSHSYDLGVIVSSAWTPTCIWGEGDSVYLTVGYSYYYSLEFVGDFLVKMDVNGNIIWKKQLVSDERVTLDYGWASAAGTYTCGAYLFSIMITKWDTNGNVIWRQKPLRGDLTSAWGNDTAVYLSGMNDLTHKLFFAKVSLAPLEWHRILVPFACGGGILCIVAYMMWKDRKSKQGQKAISSVRTAYLDRLATVCPNCGKRIAKQWEHCPYCGNKI